MVHVMLLLQLILSQQAIVNNLASLFHFQFNKSFSVRIMGLPLAVGVAILKELILIYKLREWF